VTPDIEQVAVPQMQSQVTALPLQEFCTHWYHVLPAGCTTQICPELQV